MKPKYTGRTIFKKHSIGLKVDQTLQKKKDSVLLDTTKLTKMGLREKEQGEKLTRAEAVGQVQTA